MNKRAMRERRSGSRGNGDGEGAYQQPVWPGTTAAAASGAGEAEESSEDLGNF
jgi:hypothetical protein